MRKYCVYECDYCGLEVKSDGFPKLWFQITVRKGNWEADEEQYIIDKDCCSQECLDLTLKDYVFRNKEV